MKILYPTKLVKKYNKRWAKYDSIPENIDLFPIGSYWIGSKYINLYGAYNIYIYIDMIMMYLNIMNDMKK